MNTKAEADVDPTAYDITQFDRPSVAVDIVAFVIGSFQCAKGNCLHVLLIRRGIEPFRGAWALPGGFIHLTESPDEAAQRELIEETGLSGASYLEQLYTFGRPDRDPRTRVISIAYYALLPLNEGNFANPRAGTDAAEAQWWPADALPELAFDHREIIDTALARLRAKLSYSSVAYALLPEVFTLTELQNVYEIILGRQLDKRNFRKKMLSSEILEDTGRQRREGRHRPAALFRFTRREPVFPD
ncbi:MAG: NUDIX domain-containing protein [Capsulimonadales bacterium]|nr:NUDIX domain-containing protein [Capsulimonadales bacterium]